MPTAKPPNAGLPIIPTCRTPEKKVKGSTGKGFYLTHKKPQRRRLAPSALESESDIHGSYTATTSLPSRGRVGLAR